MYTINYLINSVMSEVTVWISEMDYAESMSVAGFINY